MVQVPRRSHRVLQVTRVGAQRRGFLQPLRGLPEGLKHPDTIDGRVRDATGGSDCPRSALPRQARSRRDRRSIRSIGEGHPISENASAERYRSTHIDSGRVYGCGGCDCGDLFSRRYHRRRAPSSESRSRAKSRTQRGGMPSGLSTSFCHMACGSDWTRWKFRT